MIERYSRKEMAAIWTNLSKFQAWRQVELAVLEAREQLGQIPEGTTLWVSERTWVDETVAKAIEMRDKVIGHDLNAFLDVMRAEMIETREKFSLFLTISLDEAGEESLQQKLDEILARPGQDDHVRWFHDGMTSYDTEEPAMAMLFRNASLKIREDLGRLILTLTERARTHKGQIMIGRTHGQHAQPITFGCKLLNYLEMVERAAARFEGSLAETCAMKLSGAVGMYGTLNPDVERKTGEQLDLTVAKISTQIVALDRRAQLVGTLAEIATIVEKIAHDLWILAQTEIGEIRERFSQKQKGSSAMPHKKNPITLEQLFGLPRLIRGYADAMLQNVATANERDISHSSVERIAVPDAFGLTDYMIDRLATFIKGMEVFPDRMAENLQRTYGTIASQRVEQVLKARGMSAEVAYRVVQQACFQAMERHVHLSNVLLESDLIEDRESLKSDADFAACFDWKSWVSFEDMIYRRMRS